jgi:hypothetical protein
MTSTARRTSNMDINDPAYNAHTRAPRELTTAEKQLKAEVLGELQKDAEQTAPVATDPVIKKLCSINQDVSESIRAIYLAGKLPFDRVSQGNLLYLEYRNRLAQLSKEELVHVCTIMHAEVAIDKLNNELVRKHGN